MFQAAVGEVKVSKLKKHHLTDAVQGKKWKSNTVLAFYTRVEVCLNFCERENWLAKNPFRDKCRSQRRSVVRKSCQLLTARCIETADATF